MSEPKFTPGPWLPHIAFNDPEGFPELCVDVMKAATRDDYKLIAAAPDLYAELQNIANADPTNWDEDSRDQFQQWAQNRARAALAKARGER